ncbi:MAG: zinc ribbon domain-containing protein [Anaerolineae bacterium]|nr:zinc ribbon domain-containing protein [Anaerolineae bacterium]MDW8070582.1 zinc ribbon domain-containing protein [Anaerolineae bacterium]
MPIYEYHCHQCRRRVSIWWRTFSEAEQGTARCPRCGSENLSRMISRVRLVRSEESRLDDLSDPSQFGDLDENDPRSLGRWMRRMSQEIGEDLGPEFDEVVDRLEAGQSPEEIEKALPDLAGPESAAEDDSYLD